jgi:tRNA (guanine37-N1)-methyltransferase
VRIDVISIFPDYLAPLDLSLVGKARETGVIDVRVHDLRDWTTDRHRSVDDTPYGGGAGMVMRPDVWGTALDDVCKSAANDQVTTPAPDGSVPHLIIPSPSGRPLTQRLAHELATAPWLVFACGRYEGIDARVAEDAATRMPVPEVSIGDYVLNGGEAATLVIVEAIVRLLPGVVGNPESLVEESHGADGLLEYPVYTKPQTWRGLEVPEVLLSGHHANLTRWRRDEALRRTAQRRPDLVEALDPTSLDDRDRAVLAELGWMVDAGGEIIRGGPALD